MARRAQGFEPVKQFVHKCKHRVEGDDSRQTQVLGKSNWDIIVKMLGAPEGGPKRRPHGMVDVGRVNFRGILYTQVRDMRVRVSRPSLRGEAV